MRIVLTVWALSATLIVYVGTGAVGAVKLPPSDKEQLATALVAVVCALLAIAWRKPNG